MRSIFCATALLLALAAPSVAQETRTFMWDTSISDTSHSAATGYRVEVGPTSGATATSIDVGNVTTAVLTLQPGTSFVRLRAYNSAGTSVDVSNEVSITIAQPPPPPSVCDLQVVLVPTGYWPKDRNVKLVAGVNYSSNHPVTYRYERHGNRVDAIVFTATDVANCSVRKLKP